MQNSLRGSIIDLNWRITEFKVRSIEYTKKNEQIHCDMQDIITDISVIGAPEGE